MRQHARSRRFAVRARDGGDRNSARFVGWEEHVDDRAGNVARRSFTRRDVHAKSRTGVHFANTATCLPIGFRYVPRQEIDAADVEVDGADSPNRHLAVIGMNDVGDIDSRSTGREIRRRSQVNDFAFGRNRVLVVAELRQQSFCLVVELQARQHFLVTNAATRILVHNCNETLNRRLSITNNMTRYAFGRSNQFAVNDEQAMIESFDIAFDDDRIAMLARLRKTGLNLLGRTQVDRNATSMIA